LSPVSSGDQFTRLNIENLLAISTDETATVRALICPSHTLLDEKRLKYESLVKKVDTIPQKPEESIAFMSGDFLQEGYELSFLENYWKKRVAMKIPARGITPDTKKARSLFTSKRNLRELRQVKFIDPKYCNFEDEIEIYGDNIGIISMKEGNEHGIIIRSKSISASFRSLFNFVWNIQV
jgi:hypothetical protein